MAKIPLVTIDLARSGDSAAMERLSNLLSRSNYTISVLEAVLENMKVDSHGRTTIAHPHSRYTLSAFTACVASCDSTASNTRSTVTKLLDNLDDILTWIHQCFSSSRSEAGMTSKQILNLACWAIVLMMELDERLEQSLLLSSETLGIAFHAWTMQTSDKKPFIAVHQDRGCAILKLAAKVAGRDESLYPFADRITSNQTTLVKFCKAYSLRLLLFPEVLLQDSETTTNELITEQISLLINLGARLGQVTAVYKELRRQMFLRLAMKAITSFLLRVPLPVICGLTSVVFSMAYFPACDPVAGFVDVVENGALPVLMGGMLGPSVAVTDPEVVGTIFHAWRAFSYYPRGIRALQKAFSAAPRPVLEKMRAGSGQIDPTSWTHFMKTLKWREEVLESMTKDKGAIYFCDSDDHFTRHGPEEFTPSKTCSRCHSVIYCSARCQKEDWDIRHRTECKRMRDSYRLCKQQGIHYTQFTRAFHLAITDAAFDQTVTKMDGVCSRQFPGVPKNKLVVEFDFSGDVIGRSASRIVHIDQWIDARKGIVLPTCMSTHERGMRILRDSVHRGYLWQDARDVQVVTSIFSFNTHFRVALLVEFVQSREGEWVVGRNVASVEVKAADIDNAGKRVLGFLEPLY
ncbi:hypothetical protein CC1G_08968 [Coprinopsis cinerea okayama7|uniref:MYND-type domain-containing protein n=1 Tax=Coprinopsis cinerea (strain Okayama-7 / 130 / ATCC MYA-4618 / FGSC 9003) TaxID=240176 RepID=A8P4S9_COPC7|nr:hypothetical protein CC1G_08968 [Coprinopsis cinerea okayama7\|eukprot:XP_001838804.2 hypothetical protein CC1G_08968 [Coprinopsis cinerea okayama7\